MLMNDGNTKETTYYIAYTRLSTNDFRIEEIGLTWEEIEPALIQGTSVYIGGLRKFVEVYRPNNLAKFF